MFLRCSKPKRLVLSRVSPKLHHVQSPKKRQKMPPSSLENQSRLVSASPPSTDIVANHLFLLAPRARSLRQRFRSQSKWMSRMSRMSRSRSRCSGSSYCVARIAIAQNAWNNRNLPGAWTPGSCGGRWSPPRIGPARWRCVWPTDLWTSGKRWMCFACWCQAS